MSCSRRPRRCGWAWGTHRAKVRGSERKVDEAGLVSWVNLIMYKWKKY